MFANYLARNSRRCFPQRVTCLEKVKEIASADFPPTLAIPLRAARSSSQKFIPTP
jgi:hypothetical protein